MKHYGKILLMVLSLYALALIMILKYDLFYMINLMPDDFFVRDDSHTNQFFTFRQINEIENFANVSIMDDFQKDRTLRNEEESFMNLNQIKENEQETIRSSKEIFRNSLSFLQNI